MVFDISAIARFSGNEIENDQFTRLNDIEFPTEQ